MPRPAPVINQIFLLLTTSPVYGTPTGITRTVAERARVPIIGDKYGLPPYLARYAVKP